MALAEQSQLVVTIRLNDQMSPTAVKVGRQMQDIERKTVSLRKAMGRVGEGLKTGLANSAKIAAVGVGFLAYNIKQGIDELVEWEDAQLQITAALKSTNAASGVTAKMTEDLANKYAELSNYEDDVILGAEAILLRFPNIKKKAFEPTLAAATDLAAGMGKDLPSAARTLALALNDPNAGLGRLTRAGITFTEQQKQQIKTLVEAGKVGKAQAIILGQVNKQYGGSAQKSTEGYRGSVTRLGKAIKDLQQALAAPLIGPLGRLARRLAEFAKSPEIQQGLKDLGTAIAGLFSDENLNAGLDAVKGGLTFLRDLDWAAIKSGFQTTADIAKEAVSMFNSLPDGVKSGLITLLAANKLTGGLAVDFGKGIAGLVLNSLRTITAANVTVVGANVTTGVGGPGGAIGTGAQTAGKLGPLLSILGPAAALVGSALFVGTQFPTETIGAGTAIGGGTAGAAVLGLGQLLKLLGIKPDGGVREGTNIPSIPQFGNQRRTFGNLGDGPSGGPGLRPLQVAFNRESVRDLRTGAVEAKDVYLLIKQTEKGNITYKQALDVLRIIKGTTSQTTQAVKNQQYQFTLKPSVTISASATGNAITFAANGQRLEIL